MHSVSSVQERALVVEPTADSGLSAITKCITPSVMNVFTCQTVACARFVHLDVRVSLANTKSQRSLYSSQLRLFKQNFNME
jgi:hypothetical protein